MKQAALYLCIIIQAAAPEPSKADIHMTNKIVETCQTVNIMVHDHVIISNNKYYSFKSNMLL